MAIFPQPGLLQQIVDSTGAVKPLQQDTEELRSRPTTRRTGCDYGTINGIQFAVPNNADFKSLVWYSPKTFAEKGYTVPTTWDELIGADRPDRRDRREAVVHRHQVR